MTNIEKLLAAGGNRWTKGDHDRIYMNAEQLGLNGTTFCGEKISKTLARELAGAKTYYDVTTQRIVSTSAMLAAAMADILDADYSYGVTEIDAPEAEEETAENNETETETESETEIETEINKQEEDTMKKSDAYITEESFGSILPASWEYAAEYLNGLIDALPEDEDGEVDREDVIRIWERYSNSEYNDDMASKANAEQLEAMIRDWTEDGRTEPTPAMMARRRELKGDVIRFRVSAAERETIQALADERTNGNISSLIKSLVREAVQKEEKEAMKTETRFDLKTASCEVRARRDLVDGCCQDNPDPTLVASFRTKEEAVKALAAYRSTARYYDGFYGRGYWFATQYWVEENVYRIDEDGDAEWIDGGDVWAYSKWDRDYQAEEDEEEGGEEDGE